MNRMGEKEKTAAQMCKRKVKSFGKRKVPALGSGFGNEFQIDFLVLFTFTGFGLIRDDGIHRVIMYPFTFSDLYFILNYFSVFNLALS